MKERDESSAQRLGPVGHSRWSPRPASRARRATLLQIHPIRTSRGEILAAAMHFLIESATTQGKSTPGFSEDAATFLSLRSWDARDLASRVARAVASNQGSLITADDLSES